MTKKRRFKSGEKQELIAASVSTVAKQDMRETGEFAVDIKTAVLRKRVQIILKRKNVDFSTLEMINAIRKSDAFGGIMTLSGKGNEELITLYAEEIKLALQIVREKIARIKKSKTHLKVMAG